MAVTKKRSEVGENIQSRSVYGAEASDVNAPTADAIRERAYQVYLSRTKSGVQGDALSDWIEAERELLEKNINTLS